MSKTWRIYPTIKRVCDFLISAGALIVLLPLFFVVSALILIREGRPIFFTQLRPGKNGRIFKLYKFRTMKVSDSKAASDSEKVSSDEKRVTRLGSFLRKTSLDELPELYNVLIGDMSLVGPRPLLIEYLELYSPLQARRHEVRPGITGLAQVSGRNLLSWPARFELDVAYVDRMSFWLDTHILFKTVSTVFRRTGVSAEGHTTCAPFTGEANEPPA